jgi:hypothetical protein
MTYPGLLDQNLSHPAATVRAVDDVATLHSSAIAFADQNAMTVAPAVPAHDVGPEVCLEPTALDLPGFLTLAQKLGGRTLYLQIETFQPEPAEVVDPPARLLKRKGQPCRIEVAFAAGGVVHLWEHTAAWYTEWQDLSGSQTFGADLDDDGEPPLGEAERERLAGQAAEALLAMPGFRAAKLGTRQRFAKSHLPAGTDQRIHWDAVRAACDRADELTQQQYADIEEQYDELAAQLLATVAYRAG